MNAATVSMVMLPCMAMTADTPAAASRGPSADSDPPSAVVPPELWHEASTIRRGGFCSSPSRVTRSVPLTTCTLPWSFWK